MISTCDLHRSSPLSRREVVLASTPCGSSVYRYRLGLGCGGSPISIWVMLAYFSTFSLFSLSFLSLQTMRPHRFFNRLFESPSVGVSAFRCEIGGTSGLLHYWKIPSFFFRSSSSLPFPPPFFPFLSLVSTSTAYLFLFAEDAI